VKTKLRGIYDGSLVGTSTSQGMMVSEGIL